MSFFDLGISLSALQASQYALSVTSNNISNANTENYTRQEAVLSASDPITVTTSGGTFSLGTGVEVSTVRRMQSEFTEYQLRSATQDSGMWGAKSEALSQVEALLDEPSENGLSSVMDEFYNSWSTLASSPESTSARIEVAADGTALADQMKNLYNTFSTYQTEANDGVKDAVTNINTLAKEISDLNTQISTAEVCGASPNNLLDQRDNLISQLSEIAKVEISNQNSSQMIISMGGSVLVQGSTVKTLEATVGDNARYELTWAEDGTAASTTSGKLAGLLDLRDNTLQGYMDSLDKIASAIITSVNSVHTTGKDLNGDSGVAFFTGTDASNMAVNTAIVSDPKKVVAASDGTQGNNDIANKIEALRDASVVDGESPTEAYSTLVSLIASDSKQAQSHSDVLDASIAQLQTQRDSVSGVSLDEEMANMIKFQQSYNAAARLFTTVDSLLDTLIRMGA